MLQDALTARTAEDFQVVRPLVGQPLVQARLLQIFAVELAADALGRVDHELVGVAEFRARSKVTAV